MAVDGIQAVEENAVLDGTAALHRDIHVVRVGLRPHLRQRSGEVRRLIGAPDFTRVQIEGCRIHQAMSGRSILDETVVAPTAYSFEYGPPAADPDVLQAERTMPPGALPAVLRQGL